MRNVGTGSLGGRAAQKQRTMDEYERSDLTQAEFCRKRGIPLSTFTYWRRQLRELVGKGPGLLEVEVVGDVGGKVVRGEGVIELRLPGGVTAMVGPDTSEALLRRVLRAARPC